MFKNRIHLHRLQAILKQINHYQGQMAALSDSDLQAKTEEFKRRLSQGESLDSLLPEAYAVVREADKRILGLFPYDVQVMGAIVLHQGNVAEMATGEGKTLTATMPLYLNALTGKGVMDTFVTTLKEDQDYRHDEEKQATWFSQQGVEGAERFLGIDHLYKAGNQEIVRHLNLALRAHKLYKRDKDYVVRAGEKDDEVVLLDRATGRLMELTRMQGGQHQAIEAKEHVKLTDETRSMASITYQNLFRLFKKIAGMTGTGKVAEAEFLETYGMSVIKIPSNKPVIRKDLPDQVYASLPEKVFASLEEVKAYHQKGNPILIFTGSVEMSEIYSSLLLREGIAHNLLNANNAAREAQMIAESGQKGSVIVATSMAGRGTDIKLGEGVAQLGGLVVIGTERMENQRIDLQIRGRSGRQGDPGITKFFISLEDDLLKKWGPDWIKKYYKDYSVEQVQPKILSKRRFQRLVAKAQEASESAGKQSRKMTMDYAQSINIQRALVYKERQRLIEAESDIGSEVDKIIQEVIEDFLLAKTYSSPAELYRLILDNFSFRAQALPADFDVASTEAVGRLLRQIADKELQTRLDFLRSDKLFTHFQRVAVLKAIDENWIEQVDYLQQLRTALSGQHFSMKNPLVEYYQEAYEGFEEMKVQTKRQIVKNLLLSELDISPKGEVIMHFP